MGQVATEIAQVKIEDLKPYKNNAKQHDAEQVKKIAASIEEFGFLSPCLIDENNNIIAGHGRTEAAKSLGMETVPCVYVEGLTDEQRRAYILADNRLTELGEWNMDLVQAELADLAALDFNVNITGFDYDTMLDGIDNIEEAPIDFSEPEIEPVAKPGDIYQLGNHKLMCGDSTKTEDVERLMNGEKADLLFTDPPYNVNVSNSQGMKIENDNMNNAAFAEFLSSAFDCAYRSLKPGGAFYIWHSPTESLNFIQCAEGSGLKVHQTLIWVKNGFNFGRQDYKWKHEPCLYGWTEGAGHYFIEEYNNPTVIEDKLDLDKMKKGELQKLLEEILAEPVPTTVIHEAKPLMNDLHPTMKPLKMCADLIHNSARPGELVLDLFGGSGGTMIACEQINRRCYMMEYDPRYVDVIIERWEDFTGKKAVKMT